MIPAIIVASTTVSAIITAAAALLVGALRSTPVPLHLWVTGAVLLDGLILYLVFERRSPIGGAIVSRGRPSSPAIALTFDDGPTEPYTSQILDVLRAFDARATFFVLGARAASAPQILRRTAADGHEIGNHTWDHAALPLRSPAFVRRTIRRTSDLIEQAIGRRPRVFRAPFGWRNPWVDRAARSEGCEAVSWTVGVYDTDRPGAEVIARRAIAGMTDGAIVLLHDGRSLDPNPDASQVVQALPWILGEARQRGLRLLTVSEMLAESGDHA